MLRRERPLRTHTAERINVQGNPPKSTPNPDGSLLADRDCLDFADGGGVEGPPTGDRPLVGGRVVSRKVVQYPCGAVRVVFGDIFARVLPGCFIDWRITGTM